MEFFIDTGNLKQIKELAAFGLVDGVTTNPSLIAKEGQEMHGLLTQICSHIKGPISAEVIAQDAENMCQQAKILKKIAPNIYIKLPITMEGLKACKKLAQKGYKINMTLCFNSMQALLAAKAGASYVSPFIGRLEDIGQNAAALLEEIRDIYDQYNFQTKILAASIRTIEHAQKAALSGADAITMPPAIFKKIAEHPLTKQGLDIFNEDWKKSNLRFPET